MDITTRVYFKIVAHASSAFSAWSSDKNIICTKDCDSIDEGKLATCMNLKTNEEMLREIRDFCARLKSKEAFERPAYKVVITRNVIIYTPAERHTWYHANGIFRFVFNKSDHLLYPSTICDELKVDAVHVWDSRRAVYVPYDSTKDPQLKPNVPLYVDRVDKIDGNSAVCVRPIDKTWEAVVNSDLRELHPKLSGQIPKALTDLLECKTELVNQVNMQGVQR